MVGWRKKKETPNATPVQSCRFSPEVDALHTHESRQRVASSGSYIVEEDEDDDLRSTFTNTRASHRSRPAIEGPLVGQSHPERTGLWRTENETTRLRMRSPVHKPEGQQYESWRDIPPPPSGFVDLDLFLRYLVLPATADEPEKPFLGFGVNARNVVTVVHPSRNDLKEGDALLTIDEGAHVPSSPTPHARAAPHADRTRPWSTGCPLTAHVRLRTSLCRRMWSRDSSCCEPTPTPTRTFTAVA
jgi:hypothetical protein